MIARHIGLLANAERALAGALALIGPRHAVEPEIRRAARTDAAGCRAHVDALDPVIDRHGASRNTDGERLRRAPFRGPRLGGFGLLRDLHDLVTLATAVRERLDLPAQLSAAAGPAARAILHRLVPVRPSALAVAVALALGVAIARRAGVPRAAER